MKQDARNIFGSLLKQLVSKSDDNSPEMDIISELYNRHHDRAGDDNSRFGGSINKANKLSGEFVIALNAVADSHRESKLFLIIDGIDECPEETRLGFLERLKELSMFWTINLFVASRCESDIKATFQKEPSECTTISMEEFEAVRAPIATHIAWVLETDPEFGDTSQATRDAIRRQLIAKGKGM